MTGPAVPRPAVTARARSREDRAGDPLDGLVNLFDLGIVLSVAFLLAALTSLELSPDDLGRDRSAERAPADQVVVRRDARVRPVELGADQKVIGRGRPIGTVYQLDDGRTIVVREPSGGATAAPSGAAGTP